MLPTTGYFKDIDCPFYDKSCGRPYCHFRHRKKNQEQECPEDAQEPQEALESIPHYKPTPKSELANTKSHIPIRYVPDIVVKSDRRPIRTVNYADRPTYKPTPISLLSSTNTAKDNEYTPTSISSNISFVKDETKNEEDNNEDLDLEKLSNEFDMIDEILTDTVSSDVNGSILEETEKCKKKKLVSKKDRKSESKPKSENLKSNELKEKKDDRHRKDKYSRSSTNKSSHRDKEKESSKDKEKPSEKSSENSKEKEKSRTKKREKSKETEKTKDRSKDKITEHEKSKDKSKENDKHKDKCKENDKNKEKCKENEKHKDKYKENEKHKDRSKEHEKSKNKTKERGKTKERDKTKEKDKLTDKNKKESHHKSSSSSSGRSSDKKSKDKKNYKSKVRLESNSSSDDLTSKLELDLSSYSYNFHESEEDGDNFDSIEQECYKIFNEYVPPIVSSGVIQEGMDQDNDLPTPQIYIPTKKRIAHDNANQVTCNKVLFTKTNPLPNVALMLNHRIKIAKQHQAENEEQNLIKEMNKQNLKRPIPENKTEVKKRKISLSLYKSIKSSNGQSVEPKPVSLVDEILNIKSKPFRIAPVQNVGSIQKAKAKIQEQLKNVKPLKTQAQTISRGVKRTAHVPDDSLGELPDVLNAEASKLPVNVRTRYLTMLADECVKLYVYREDAYQRALSEEFKCYEKCSALVTYRNSAMLAVNRIRKEVKERDNSGLGPLQSGECSKTNTNSPLQGEAFYNNILSYTLTEEELVLHGYPRESSVPGRADIHSDKPARPDHMDSNERLCCRCHKSYQTDDYGFPLIQQDCIYHPLRKRTLRGERTYLCCKSTEDTGCVVSKTHVSEMLSGAELDGYQSTMDPERSNDPRSTAVYALDCEMCYTIVGLELTRVTIVDTNLKTVYETLVKPLNPIIDYNTRFSGITKDQMDRTSTSILQVQANILHLCNSKTILIGHSLESDMKALKIIHSTVIDTSVMFPHKFGLPHKRALKMLASEYLRKIIQNDVGGHDSAEDALSCMELVIWKIKEDLKVKNMK